MIISFLVDSADIKDESEKFHFIKELAMISKLYWQVWAAKTVKGLDDDKRYSASC